jgi:hypothetical protein
MRDIDSARAAAQEYAMFDLQGLYSGPAQEVLDADYRETEHCWMFFQRNDISFPPERSLSKGAYAISKHSGEERFVPDFRHDEPRLLEYLQLISDYFAKSASKDLITPPDR